MKWRLASGVLCDKKVLPKLKRQVLPSSIQTNYIVWGELFACQELSHSKDGSGGDKDVVMDVWVCSDRYA